MDTSKKLMEINIQGQFLLMKTKQNNIYEELRIKIKDLIRSITKNSDDYDEKYMKIKFNLDDELHINKTKFLTSQQLLEQLFMKTINIIQKFFRRLSK